MVHFSDRRYRLNGDEVGPVMQLVRDRLSDLLLAQDNLAEAEILYRVLYRFETYQVGRPSYPEPVTWDAVEALLGKGPLPGSEDEPTEEEMKARFEEDPQKCR